MTLKSQVIKAQVPKNLESIQDIVCSSKML